MNSQIVGNTSQLYSYRSHLETLLKLCKESQETRFLCKSWTKDTIGHMGVIAVGWNNAGLNDRLAKFAKSSVIELISRPHLDVFNQKHLVPPNIYLHIKLVLSLNYFVCKSAAQYQGAQPKNYKLVIQSFNFFIHTKKLISKAHCALINLSFSEICGIIYCAYNWNTYQSLQTRRL